MQVPLIIARCLAFLTICLSMATLPSDKEEPIGLYRVMGDIRQIPMPHNAVLEGVGNGFVEITANPGQVGELRAQGYVVEAQPQPKVAVDSGYHTYAAMADDIAAVATAHPDIVSTFSIGTSYQGRALLAAKVSDNVASDEQEPEVLLVGHYHAREHLTVEMMLANLHMLVDGYGTAEHARIDQLVNTREIWLVFDMNPDGGEYDTTGDIYRNWRKNMQPSGCGYSDSGYGAGSGIDLNRNHTYRWGYDDGGSSGDLCSETYRGAHAASATEVAALEQFVASRVVGGTQQITAAISFHTYGELVLWPYGYTASATPEDMPAADAQALAALGQAMAAANGYTAEQASVLYPTNGDFSDWAYGSQHIFGYTFEMSGYHNGTFYGFYPPSAAIETETARNREAVLLLIQHAGCPYTLTGQGEIYCTTAPYVAQQSTWLPIVSH